MVLPNYIFKFLKHLVKIASFDYMSEGVAFYTQNVNKNSLRRSVRDMERFRYRSNINTMFLQYNFLKYFVVIIDK